MEVKTMLNKSKLTEQEKKAIKSIALDMLLSSLLNDNKPELFDTLDLLRISKIITIDDVITIEHNICKNTEL